jgi:hypothetical protein
LAWFRVTILSSQEKRPPAYQPYKGGSEFTGLLYKLALTFQWKCTKLKTKTIALQEGTAVCTKNSFEIVSVGMKALWATQHSTYMSPLPTGLASMRKLTLHFHYEWW